MKTKRVFCVLLLFALALLLTPAREARADYQPGDTCPTCHEADNDTTSTLRWESISPQSHILECNNGDQFGDPQQHTFEWHSEDGQHWQKCTVCGWETDKASHAFVMKDIGEGKHQLRCECGATSGEAEMHNWNDEWSKDGERHWHECATCHMKKDENVHSFGNWTPIAGTDTHKGTCECGAEKTENHVYDIIKGGADGHWKECVCGAKEGEPEAHVWTYNKDETVHQKTCSECDYSPDEEPVIHNWQTKYDADKHWLACECGLTKDEEAHSGGTATCVAKAVCTVCEQSYGDIDPDNHDWVIDAAVAATCTKTGLTEGKHCSRCTEKVAQEETPALGHDWVIDKEAVAATCEGTGLTEGKHCSRCDEKVEQKEITALGHEWVTEAAAIAPTCMIQGRTEYRSCNRCNTKVGADPINELGHDWVIDKEGVAATCTETGLTEGRHCSRCDVVEEQKEAPALGHDWVIDKEALEATCTETGLTEGRHCSRCDLVEAQKKIPARGHAWVVDKEAVEPTPTQTGLTEGKHCSRCDAKVEQQVIPVVAPEKDQTASSKRSASSNQVYKQEIKPEIPFKDVDEDMDIYDDVKYVYEKGIMDGMSETEFGPELTLTRGLFATILYIMEGKPEVEYAGAFSDVPAGKWYSNGVEWVASIGALIGYGDGTYGVMDDLTREQMAAYLYWYARWRDFEIKTVPLDAADAEDVSHWALDGMGWAVANGILLPDEDGNIRPGEAATRGEIAIALHIFLEKVTHF